MVRAQSVNSETRRDLQMGLIDGSDFIQGLDAELEKRVTFYARISEEERIAKEMAADVGVRAGDPIAPRLETFPSGKRFFHTEEPIQVFSVFFFFFQFRR